MKLTERAIIVRKLLSAQPLLLWPHHRKKERTFSGWSEIPATMPAHDVKVIGSFSLNSYMVKFVVDGKVIYEKLQAYGSKIVVPTVEERRKATHSLDSETWTKLFLHTMLPIMASYIANKYKVTFVADGKVVSETEMEYGAPIVAQRLQQRKDIPLLAGETSTRPSLRMMWSIPQSTRSTATS